MKKLLIVVPCYNEEEVLPSTLKTMSALLKKMIKNKLAAPDSRIHFVNDGSTDKTWEILQKACQDNPLFEATSLSRNFGHQGAILAGMYDNDADVYATIDADLQDDPECIVEMMQKINGGCDIVYGVRKKRDTDTFFKRFTAQSFYRLMSLLGVRVIYNHADFRMMTHRAVNELKQFPERNLFLRAVVPLVGFKSDMVYYDRTARTAGETKYPLKKMLAFAWNGISSFSIVPLSLHFFTYKNIAELLSACGLGLEQISYTSLPTDGYQPHKTEELPAAVADFILKDSHSHVFQYILSCKAEKYTSYEDTLSQLKQLSVPALKASLLFKAKRLVMKFPFLIKYIEKIRR